MAEPLAILAAGRAFRLPPGSAAVPPGTLRPVPGAALPGLALHQGRALPVFALGGGDLVRVRIEQPGGAVLLAGDALLDALPEDALPLPPLRLDAAPPPALPPAPAPLGAAAAAPPRTGARELVGALRLWLGEAALTLPLAAAERIAPMPPLVRLPGAPPGVLGLALLDCGAALVLDPAWCAGRAPDPDAAPTLLALLGIAGRRFGLPCARVEPGDPDLAALLPDRIAALPRLLALAPMQRERPPPPRVETRLLLLCRAAGREIAFPVEEIAAVIAPTRPAPPPAGALSGVRGIVAHRGEVLPVIDAGERLGGAPCLAEGAAPLLRLAGPRPVALAVGAVAGLRRVALPDLAAAAAEGPVAALVAAEGGALPVLRGAVLAGLRP
jgi:chemotaxis signal transduction protein